MTCITQLAIWRPLFSWAPLLAFRISWIQCICSSHLNEISHDLIGANTYLFTKYCRTRWYGTMFTRDDHHSMVRPSLDRESGTLKQKKNRIEQNRTEQNRTEQRQSQCQSIIAMMNHESCWHSFLFFSSFSFIHSLIWFLRFGFFCCFLRTITHGGREYLMTRPPPHFKRQTREFN